MENDTFQSYGCRWYERVRLNYTLMFFVTALISTLLPAFLFWGRDFWHNIDSVKINTVMGIFITCILAGFSLSRMLRFPGVNALSYMIPTVTAVYGGLFGVLLLIRLEYSRPVIAGSYLLVLTFCWVIYYLGVRYGKVKYAIIPVGNYDELCEISSVEWHIFNKPNVSQLRCDAVVADFRSQELTEEWKKFLANCALSRIPVYHSKQIYESLTGRISVEQLHENCLGAIIPSLFYASFKRVVDVIMVMISLPLVIPIMFFTAVSIKLDSPGPLFFIQKRVGLGNKDFIMYKFRSMHSNAELDGAKLAQVCDGRVTRVGNFIRKYRIDELPQFFNVFKGDMSLIGPRPEQRFFVEKFECELPFYMYRHMVRPGISGWAQVMYGYSADTDSTRIKVEYDFYYIKNFSLWLDLLIVFKTIKTILTGFGAR